MKSPNKVEEKCRYNSATAGEEANASFMLSVAISLLNDIARLVTYEPSKDINTLCRRVKHEGISFLTITLSDFCSDVQQALEIGQIQPSFFRGFRKNGAIPSFLKGMLAALFDSDGRILTNVDVAFVNHIRQFCFCFKKVKLPCKGDKIHAAYKRFKQDEEDLQRPIEPSDVSMFAHVASALWTDFSTRVANSYSECEWMPKHGPGAVGERGIRSNSKYRTLTWHDRLEPYFPILGTKLPLSAYDSKEFDVIKEVGWEQEESVRIITVPKTLKSPRIIAIEPCCMQYTQQALAGLIVPALGKYKYTKGQILFTDQEVHRGLALDASKSRYYATLDLSSASDRVPNDLVRYMFASSPILDEAIQACRSRTAKLPSGEIIHLKKFASMGSSLCFPIEAMYFYTICVIALLEARGLDISKLRSVTKDIFIYGDDIIVPVKEVTKVIETLQKYYCKVGSNKSFYRGFFRESCGMDAYNGVCVTPAYLRSMLPQSLRDSSGIISNVAFSRQLFRRGFWLTADFISSSIEKIIKFELPVTSEYTPGLGKNSFLPGISVSGWSKRYQCLTIKTLVPEPVYEVDIIDGYHALTKVFITQFNEDKDHLSRSTRSGIVKLKFRRVHAYA